MSEMLKIDYLYGGLIWLDLKILLRTVPYVCGADSELRVATFQRDGRRRTPGVPAQLPKKSEV